MPEVIAALVRTEARDALAEQWPEGLDRPAARGAHDRFEFREGEFDRVEVGTVRGEIPDDGPRAGQGLLHPADFVCPKVVGDHDVAGTQRGHEDLVEVGEKARAIDRAVEDPGRREAGHAEGGQKRTRLPAGTRRVIVDARPRQTTAVAPQQIRGDAGLVEKREPGEIPRRRLLLPGGTGELDVRAIVFGRPYRFF